MIKVLSYHMTGLRFTLHAV